jgi:hypothetical protein
MEEVAALQAFAASLPVEEKVEEMEAVCLEGGTS